MARRIEPWILWAGAGAGALGLAGLGYAIATLASSQWPGEGDLCSLETYRAVLGNRTDDAAIQAAHRYMPQLRYAASQNGVDPHLLAGLVHTESDWNPDAGSGQGAVGLSQHIPSTAVNRFRILAESNRWPFGELRRSNDPQRDGYFSEQGVSQWIDRTDPRQSLWLGAASLRALLDANNGIEWALAAYNAGPKGANSSPWPQETQNYVPAVLKRRRWYDELDAACRGVVA